MADTGKLGADVQGLLDTAQGCLNAVTISETTKASLTKLLAALRAATGSAFIQGMIALLEAVIQWLTTTISALTKFAEFLKGHANKQKALADKTFAPEPTFQMPQLPRATGTGGLVDGFLNGAAGKGEVSGSLLEIKNPTELNVANGKVEWDYKHDAPDWVNGVDTRGSVAGSLSLVEKEFESGPFTGSAELLGVNGKLGGKFSADWLNGVDAGVEAELGGSLIKGQTELKAGDWDFTFGGYVGPQVGGKVELDVLNGDHVGNLEVGGHASLFGVNAGVDYDGQFGRVGVEAKWNGGVNGGISINDTFPYVHPEVPTKWIPEVDYKWNPDYYRINQALGENFPIVPFYQMPLPPGPQLTPEAAAQVLNGAVPAAPDIGTFLGGGR